jgi:peptidoglycan/xylan/chitin deacetylase (PgdA/CDA1 family)
MRRFRPGLLVRALYPEGLFRKPAEERLLYLSFDDGPDKWSTQNILGILRRYGIKAMFFCTGVAAEENPDVIVNIRLEGHLVGNHGYYHLDGFRTSSERYINNAKEADNLTSSKIFRPPYGRLTPLQYRKLKDDYSLVFWDVMPYDFDSNFPASSSLGVLKHKVRNGSVIVLHDDPDSSVHTWLDEFINFALSTGYSFDLPLSPNR